MHKISNAENEKRGCLYCLDKAKGVRIDVGGGKIDMIMCKHDKCPYNELDKHERYKDYLKEVVKEFDVLDMIRK